MGEKVFDIKFIAKLKADLAKDKKKAAILALLAAVGLFVVAKQTIFRAGPARAKASVAKADNSAAGAAVKHPAARRGDEERRTEFLKTLGRDFGRDLFAPYEVYFPQVRQVEVPAIVPASGPATRSAAEDIEREREAELRRQQVMVQAKAMTLQSTMVSDTPTAVIDNRVLRVGDWIGGFEVKAIDEHGCVIEKDNVQVSLQIHMN